MSFTVAQLADAVLKKLGAIASGETAATADVTLVTDAYAAKWEELAAPGQELIFWSQADIPNYVFLIMRDLVALQVCDAFGQPMSEEDRQAREDIILHRLRRIVAVDTSEMPVQADYF
jgi:hypothetical protein